MEKLVVRIKVKKLDEGYILSVNDGEKKRTEHAIENYDDVILAVAERLGEMSPTDISASDKGDSEHE